MPPPPLLLPPLPPPPPLLLPPPLASKRRGSRGVKTWSTEPHLWCIISSVSFQSGGLMGWLIGCCWCMERLMGRFAGWLMGWFIGWSRRGKTAGGAPADRCESFPNEWDDARVADGSGAGAGAGAKSGLNEAFSVSVAPEQLSVSVARDD